MDMHNGASAHAPRQLSKKIISVFQVTNQFQRMHLSPTGVMHSDYEEDLKALKPEFIDLYFFILNDVIPQDTEKNLSFDHDHHLEKKNSTVISGIFLHVTKIYAIDFKPHEHQQAC